MNSKNALLGFGLALLMITPVRSAVPSAYAAIVKERDTVLAKIVAEVESRHALGTADDDMVWAARLSLLSFRRDAASTPGEKLKQQALIVALQEQRLGMLKARSAAGTAGPLDILRATDALLAAKQLQAEMQLEGKTDYEGKP